MKHIAALKFSLASFNHRGAIPDHINIYRNCINKIEKHEGQEFRDKLPASKRKRRKLTY
jgi:hypothetical protein